MIVSDVSTPVVVLTMYNHLGLGLIRSLGRCGIPVHCIHPDPGVPAMYSRYVSGRYLRDVVNSPAHEVVDLLGGIARTLGRRPILVPTSDDTAMFVAAHAASLEGSFIFPVQPESLVHALSSKREMHFLAKELGVPTPETLFPMSRAELVDSIGKVRFPVVLKGIDGNLLNERRGVKMVIVRTKEELLANYDRLEDPDHPNLMLQEYIPGGEDSVWMFNGYFNRDSECLMGMTGQKIRQAPAYTGFTSLGICRPNEAVDRTTREFMKRIGYRGMLDVGYRYDVRDGRYKVLDVNPRIGATFRLFVGDNGLDVARAAYLDLTGQDVPPARMRPGRRWLLEDLDMKSSCTYFRDGKLSVGRWIGSFRGVEEAAYFARDDFSPFFRMGVNHLKQVLARARRWSPRGGRATTDPR